MAKEIEGESFFIKEPWPYGVMMRCWKYFTLKEKKVKIEIAQYAYMEILPDTTQKTKIKSFQKWHSLSIIDFFVSLSFAFFV